MTTTEGNRLILINEKSTGLSRGTFFISWERLEWALKVNGSVSQDEVIRGITADKDGLIISAAEKQK